MDVEKLEAGIEADRLVAAIVMQEPQPTYIPDDALEKMLSSNPYKSEKGNWILLCDYEKDDVPEWEPLSFTKDIRPAFQVHQTACRWLFSKRRKYLNELARLLQTQKADGTNRECIVAWPDALIFLTPLVICQAALKVAST